MFLLNEGVPLHDVARHVEGCKEHLAVLLSGLDKKELLTTVEPGQGILCTIIRRKQQLMSMVHDCGDWIVGRAGASGAVGLQLVRLETVHGDIQL
jgi:hypothetical protein